MIAVGIALVLAVVLVAVEGFTGIAARHGDTHAMERLLWVSLGLVVAIAVLLIVAVVGVFR
jgi:hypothetical protein